MVETEVGFGLWDPANVGSYPGRVVEVRPGDKDVAILDLRQSDDRQAAIVTITLSFRSQGTEITEPLRAPIAHIDWGVSGGRDSIDVDFLHGQVLSVTATYVRITASFPLEGEILFGGGSLGQGFGITDSEDPKHVLLLGANLGAQPHPQSAFGATPRLTTFVALTGEEAPLASPFVPVPSHAQSVTVLARAALGPVNVGAFTIDQPSGLLYETNVAEGADVHALPIARGVEYLRVSATPSEDVPQIVTLLWSIGL